MSENGNSIERGRMLDYTDLYPHDWSPLDEAKMPYTPDVRRLTERFVKIPGGRTIWRRDRDGYRVDDDPGESSRDRIGRRFNRKFGPLDAIAELTEKNGDMDREQDELPDWEGLAKINQAVRPVTLGEIASSQILYRIVRTVGTK